MGRKNKSGGQRATRGRGWELISAKRGGGSAARTTSDAPEAQSIKVREEKRAQGKVVTVAKGFRLTPGDLKKLGKQLKSSCGAGGTTLDDAVEVQGHHREQVLKLLTDAGYRAS